MQQVSPLLPLRARTDSKCSRILAEFHLKPLSMSPIGKRPAHGTFRARYMRGLLQAIARSESCRAFDRTGFRLRSIVRRRRLLPPALESGAATSRPANLDVCGGGVRLSCVPAFYGPR